MLSESSALRLPNLLIASHKQSNWLNQYNQHIPVIYPLVSQCLT